MYTFLAVPYLSAFYNANALEPIQFFSDFGLITSKFQVLIQIFKFQI
jgi:hypothetical protein